MRMCDAAGRTRIAVLALVTVAAAAAGWWAWGQGDAALVERRLRELTRLLNEPVPAGIGAVARASEIGNYFTEDVTIQLGQGTSPIEGRAMLTGMLARLQQRTAAYRLAVDDITVRLESEGDASVALTGRITSRGAASDENLEAREFALRMSKHDGTWRVARVTTVDTLR